MVREDNWMVDLNQTGRVPHPYVLPLVLILFPFVAALVHLVQCFPLRCSISLHIRLELPELPLHKPYCLKLRDRCINLSLQKIDKGSE